MGHCISWDGWAGIFEFLDSRAFVTNRSCGNNRDLWAFCVILASNQNDDMISTEQVLERTLVDIL